MAPGGVAWAWPCHQGSRVAADPHPGKGGVNPPRCH